MVVVVAVAVVVLDELSQVLHIFHHCKYGLRMSGI